VILKIFLKDLKKKHLEPKKFAEYCTEYSTKVFCKLIDQNLYNELLTNVSLIEKEAKENKINWSCFGQSQKLYSFIFFNNKI
jgi:hypothetical protein